MAKYMGDGVLIYFGYPEAHEDDAERAVRAGELITAVRKLEMEVPSASSFHQTALKQPRRAPKDFPDRATGANRARTHEGTTPTLQTTGANSCENALDQATATGRTAYLFDSCSAGANADVVIFSAAG